jgi:hypothetical protein
LKGGLGGTAPSAYTNTRGSNEAKRIMLIIGFIGILLDPKDILNILKWVRSFCGKIFKLFVSTTTNLRNKRIFFFFLEISEDLSILKFKSTP